MVGSVLLGHEAEVTPPVGFGSETRHFSASEHQQLGRATCPPALRRLHAGVSRATTRQGKRGFRRTGGWGSGRTALTLHGKEVGNEVKKVSPEEASAIRAELMRRGHDELVAALIVRDGNSLEYSLARLSVSARELKRSLTDAFKRR
jgi:hypothetical protein